MSNHKNSMKLSARILLWWLIVILIAVAAAAESSSGGPASLSQECSADNNKECEWKTENDPSTSPKKKNKKMTETLIFGGSLAITSDPLPDNTDPVTTTTQQQVVTQFLREQRDDNLGCIMSGGVERHVEEIPRSDLIDQLWADCCDDTYGNEYLPASGDPIFATNTTSSFPGLTLTTTVYNGAKVVLRTTDPDETNNTGQQQPQFSSYVFLMIGEQQTPKGFRPLVSLFRKLMSFSCDADDSLRPCGRAKSIFTVVPVADDHNQHGDGGPQLAFSMIVDLRIRVEFPAVLLKLLPMKKEKVEAIATNAIFKTIRKDVENILQEMHKHFSAWSSATATASRPS